MAKDEFVEVGRINPSIILHLDPTDPPHRYCHLNCDPVSLLKSSSLQDDVVAKDDIFFDCVLTLVHPEGYS